MRVPTITRCWGSLRSPQPTALIFWLETFAVCTFAAYWIIKTGEMRETKAERRALDAELKREVVPAAPPEVDASRVGGVPSAIVRNLSPKSAEVEAVVPAVSAGEH